MAHSDIITAVATAFENDATFSMAAHAVVDFDQLPDGLRHLDVILKYSILPGGEAFCGGDTRDPVRLEVGIIHSVVEYSSNAAFEGARADASKRARDLVITNQPGRSYGISVWDFEGEVVEQRGLNAVTRLTFTAEATTPNAVL